MHEFIAAIVRGLLAGMFGGVIGGVTGSVAGATGAALLNGAGYPNHDPNESAGMAALGNALILGAASFSTAANSRDRIYFFAPKPRTVSHLCLLVLTFCLQQALGTALGYGLLRDDMTTGTLGSVTADAEVGSLLTLLPLALLAACLIACYCPQSTSEEQQRLTL